MLRLTAALFVAAVVPFVHSQNETSRAASSINICCTALWIGPLRDRLLLPGEPSYESRIGSYFDIKQQALTPNCILQPRNTEEVALAVQLFTIAGVFQQCKFAIRSGGHTPYAGASNIEDGITLDLQYINAVEYDAANNLVNVGPGATWWDVFTTLEPLGTMTTGGRSSTVGVGGLVLGGGISYFSPEHGLVCDNVLEFEVVLAGGRVVTASKDSNPDLFTVLKGGNNNFGVVTNLKFRTFKYDGLWGGIVSYPGTTIQDQFKALINFSNNIDKNPKSAAIVIATYDSTIGADMILNCYDNAEPVAKPAAYNEFLAIPGNLSDSTGLRNMSDLASEFAGVTTFSVYFGTLTFANDLRVMTKADEIYKEVLANLQAKAKGSWSIYVLYQPLPPAYWKDSATRGGNILGLERFNDQVLCLYQPYLSWQGAEQDALFQGAGAELVKRIGDFAKSIGADNPYLYLDYADSTQDPLKGYGAENVEKMKAASKKYDPFQVFQNLVPGGFKISKVQ